MRPLLIPVLVLSSLAVGGAAAQPAPSAASAQREAEEARRRSEALERQAGRASSEAARANAAAAALAARIEAAEADITAAQARIREIEALRASQRARLAEQQGSLVRLTAALQTVARRPPALALVQPGSLNDAVHVRALLASSLPAIRARTAGVRAEVARGNALKREAELAVARLKESQTDLQRRRVALAQFEQRQRARSETLLQTALGESDRALAFGEEARELAALAGTRQFQAELSRRLAELPGPVLRPGTSPAVERRGGAYRLPVEGRLVTGTGEISDAGVHARGLSFEVAPGTPVVAPRSGRVAYAGPFRGYDRVVIIDHGGGWTTTLTHLRSVQVTKGQAVQSGQAIGQTGAGEVGVELRRNGAAFPIALLL
ncbi:MAG TPA: peptidoglycan DD-metalloendopeptidase family protein [Allosphingosinicella sp.]|jgi:septal ring factor EnvC (AmiA/AmiB activator)